MKKRLFILGCISAVCATTLAQVKNNLAGEPNLLDSPKKIETSDEYDVLTNTNFLLKGNYTLEIKAKVTSADQRGLDVEAKSASGEGFRTFITPDQIKAAPYTFGDSLLVGAIDNASQLQTYRFMMYNDQLSLFVNNAKKAEMGKRHLQGKNIINENEACFHEGAFDYGMFGDWQAFGVGETVEIVDTARNNSRYFEKKFNRCLHVSFPSKLGTVDVASLMVLGLKPGATYDISYQYLPYLSKSPGGGNNMTIGVYADPATTTSMAAKWHNGYFEASGTDTIPTWKNFTMRFTMGEDQEYVFVRLMARNNPCNIYFDNFQITEVSYPSEFPSFPAIDMSNGSNLVANTGIYNKQNLWWDQNPGFEWCIENGNANARPDGTTLPADSARWFSNLGLGSGSAGGARCMNIENSTPAYGELAEGKRVYMYRFESGYQYFSFVMPTDRMKPNTAYKASCRLWSFKTPTNNKQFYLNAGEAKDGASGIIYNSVVATIPEFIVDDPLTEDIDETQRGTSIVEVPFFTPAELPKNIYLTLRYKDSGDILFGGDEFVLIESQEEFTPKGSFLLGKNFFKGEGIMEIESVKCVDEAFLPDDGSGLANNKTADGNVFYADGNLYLQNIDTESNLTICDLSGVVLYQIALNGRTQLPLQLSQGTYVAKVGNVTNKLIVQ